MKTTIKMTEQEFLKKIAEMTASELAKTSFPAGEVEVLIERAEQPQAQIPQKFKDEVIYWQNEVKDRERRIDDLRSQIDSMSRSMSPATYFAAPTPYSVPQPAQSDFKSHKIQLIKMMRQIGQDISVGKLVLASKLDNEGVSQPALSLGTAKQYVEEYLNQINQPI